MNSGFNFYSPTGQIIKFVPFNKAGFFVYAHSKNAPLGWGDPHVDKDGEPVPAPGTIGGPNPIQFVNFSGGKWKCNYSPGTQLYGNIDWEGPWIESVNGVPVKSKGRLRVSYHGPKSRIFADDAFTYGLNSKHNYIYRNGLCIAVAPYPVMGAGIREETIVGRVTPVQYLIVACYRNALTTEFYKIPFILDKGVDSEGLTPEFIEKAMKIDGESITFGTAIGNNDPPVIGGVWKLIGKQENPTCAQGDVSCKVLTQRVPWFFSGDGKTAYQMKTVDITHNFCTTWVDVSDKSVQTSKGYNLYKATISDNSVTFEDKGNLGGFRLRTQALYQPMPDYVANCQWPSFGSPIETHTWGVKVYQHIYLIDGRYNVAVDMVDGELTLLFVEANCRHTADSWWYTGIDTTVGNTVSYSNEGDILGDKVGRPDSTITGGDGRTSDGLGIHDSIYLKWRAKDPATGLPRDYSLKVVNRGSGTENEFNNQPWSPNNNLFYYFWDVVTYPMNLKPNLLSGAFFTEERVRVVTGSTSVSVRDRDFMSHMAGSETPAPINNVVYKDHTEYGELGHSDSGPPNTWETSFDNTLAYKIYSPSYPASILNYPRMAAGKIVTPAYEAFFNGALVPENQPTLYEMFSGSKSRSYSPDIGISNTDTGDYILSIGYLQNHYNNANVLTKVQRYYNIIEPGHIKLKDLVLPNLPPSTADVSGNEAAQYWFYPLGT